MRNMFRKNLLLTVACLLATNLFAQKTYTFDDGVALATDWTVVDNTASVGGTAKCEIAAPSKFSAKNNNYLLFSFENKSGISISITSTASFSNISNITFDAVANDNGKPNWTLDIVDDNGNVQKNIYSAVGSKDRFNTGGSNKWGVSNDAVSPAVSGHIKLTLTASSSGKYAAIDNLVVTYQAGPSTDATLSALTYDGTSVPDFSAETTSYEVELPADYTGVPTVAATKSDNNATVNITQATAVPGTASVLVTAEDGTTTKTYTVTFTKESADPKVESATWPNIRGTAVIDQVNKTITGQVLNGSSLSLEPTFTGKYLNSQSPTGVQNFANGAISYTFTSASNAQTVYSVTITESPAVSTDATLSSLTYGGKSVPNFSPSTLTYNIELTAGIKTPPTIAATPNDNKATMNITQASSVPGVGKVKVTAEDGTTTLTYTVNFTVAVPQSGLTIHVPEIYEAKEIAGGYNGTLAVFNSREYEVYYAGKTTDSYMTVDVKPCQKLPGITNTSSATACKAKDGWFEATGNSISNYSFPNIDEFAAGEGCMHKIYDNNAYKFHIQGYDQFSFYGKDNSTTIDPNNASKNKRFQVYIDNVLQPENPSNTASIRRYDISTGEHVIEVRGIGASNNEFYGWSLRVAQEPRTKWLKGNDSSQVVLQTAAIRPVTYATKYNNLNGAETRLLWDGAEASGFELVKTDGTLSDTLQLSGVANCPVGTYHYRVAAFYNGIETSSVSGSFTVKSSLKATSDLSVDAYQNEDMEDPITFRYYALSASDVQLTWTGTVPDGISGSGNNGIYTISGRPTTIGIYPYSITVTGADTTFTGKVTVKELNMGNNPILYLHRNSGAAEKDPVFKYLTSSAGGSKNLIARKARRDGLRSADQYASYKWILISEDADADNEEVLAIIRGGVNLPVFNMQGFTYATNRLGWGYPDNGTVDTTSHNGCNIYVQRNDHPIFSRFSVEVGDKLPIFEKVERNGIMPIAISGEAMQNTLCLATGYTRDIDEYDQDGELQTAIHEIPAAMRGGKKYICMPMAINANNKLSAHGKGLIDAIVAYLLDDNTAAPAVPELRINSFSIMGVAGTIDQTNNTIDMAFNVQEYPNLELNEVVPQITLADPTYTFVTPASGDTVDFRYSTFMPVKFVVSDFISSRVYNVIVRTYDPQGLENVYEVGEWVNIFDIYGRKIATTNEDIYTMELPHGVYLVVTENGQTIKLMR